MANLGYIVNFEINLGYIVTLSKKKKTNKTNREDTHTHTHLLGGMLLAGMISINTEM